MSRSRSTPDHSGPARRRVFAAAALAVCCAAASCQGPQSQTIGPPGRYKVESKYTAESGRLLVKSDFQLPKDHELIRDLDRLRDHLIERLELPPPERDVVVYLFDDELQYTQYLNATFPGLPQRRAYFVGTRQQLAVYTYWGSRIQEDLRHEYTHGVLHASLGHVPLWLDEGLAEYFEIPGAEPGRPNPAYVRELTKLIADGWRPDLAKLEGIVRFEDMQQEQYQEAWAWVHFMLHGSDDTRACLLSYLDDLRRRETPEPLSARLAAAVPQVEQRFMAHMTSLPQPEPAKLTAQK